MSQNDNIAALENPVGAKSVTRFLLVVLLGAVAGWGLNWLWKIAAPTWTSRVVMGLNPMALRAATDPASLAIEVSTQATRATSEDLLRRTLERADVADTEWARLSTGRDGKLSFVDATTRLRESLHAESVPGTRLFTIEFMSRYPDDAPVIVNALAEEITNDNRQRTEAQFAASERAATVRRDRLEEEIRRSEREMIDFVTTKRLDARALSAQSGDSGSKGSDDLQAIIRLRTLQERHASLEQRRGEIERALQDLQMHMLAPDRILVEIVQKGTAPRRITFPRLRYTVPATALAFGFIWAIWPRRATR